MPYFTKSAMNQLNSASLCACYVWNGTMQTGAERPCSLYDIELSTIDNSMSASDIWRASEQIILVSWFTAFHANENALFYNAVRISENNTSASLFVSNSVLEIRELHIKIANVYFATFSTTKNILDFYVFIVSNSVYIYIYIYIYIYQTYISNFKQLILDYIINNLK